MISAPAPLTITDADLDVPQEPAGSPFPPGLGLGSDDEGPEDAFAMPVRESNARPPWVFVLGGLVALAVVVVLFILVFGDDDDPASPDGASGQVSGEQAVATMCGHVQQMQMFRADSLGAAAEQLREDAAALKQAGERRTSTQVRRVVASIEDAREALANQEDTAEPFAELQADLDALPC